MENLISNTFFGNFCKSKESEFKTKLEYLVWYEKVRNNFDAFLIQSLTLGMLVPVGDDGEVLSEPEHIYSDSPDRNKSKLYQNSQSVIDFKIAKERVLFEGWKYHKDGYCYLYSEKDEFKIDEEFCFGLRVETLASTQVELTPTAIKQIFG